MLNTNKKKRSRFLEPELLEIEAILKSINYRGIESEL